jgi:uncharacterized protein DUF4397
MRRIIPFSALCLAIGTLGGCRPEEVIDSPVPPTAGVRFINAVPDTGQMDFRPVDLVENVTFYNVGFRGTNTLYYKNARAGTRHFRIFRTPDPNTTSATQIAVANTVVADLDGEELEANKRYTYILWGYSRPGSTPAMKVTRLTDDPADPGAQVSVRVINACVAGLCGSSADGTVDARIFTTAQTINSPAATFAATSQLTASNYVNVATGTYTFDFRPAGGVTTGAALAAGTGPAGTAQTVDLEAIPGTNVAGSAVTALLVPRSLAGSTATSFTTPGVLFLWDRRPPRTCALCGPTP